MKYRNRGQNCFAREIIPSRQMGNGRVQHVAVLTKYKCRLSLVKEKFNNKCIY